MKFSAALITAALAGSVLARPSSLGDRVSPRANGSRHRKSHPAEKLGTSVSLESTGGNTGHKVEYSTTWSGASLQSPSQGYFKAVTGRFTVPLPKHVGSNGTEYSSAWVGIDGDTCETGLLQAGVDIAVADSGEVSYDAWYEWYPDQSYTFTDFAVSAGNVIQVDITAISTTKGKVKITNISTGKHVSQTLSAPKGSVLCRLNAEWIVEDFDVDDIVLPMSNFGTVAFTDTCATLSTGGTEELGRALVYNIKQGNTVYTDTTINGANKFTVKYTQEKK
ncbi:hypothetical protein HBI56_120190 [Parastagonospora nodorum]|nr:hypothetical protein HBH50_136680 [Parastagonospora nodorum]KAH4085165.1 hypothetical protein HBH48_157280 [Parastagonospora nodorum]KAH4176194.1 hypothetical protein HBH43_055050 [Parastagonospora nodorum]KAH4195754.1 hypothetical protein HBH42_076480 [Parastagonospora nodorum]KAH4220564.1 hypothetical protein HBI06_168350 [Parastagonospora nodorum]